MPRRNRRKILGKRMQYEQQRREQELKELERELHHDKRRVYKDHEVPVEDTPSDDQPTTDD